MTETLAYGYSSERTQRELSNEYQTWQGYDGFQKSLRPCASDGSSLSIGRVKGCWGCTNLFWARAQNVLYLRYVLKGM